MKDRNLILLALLLGVVAVVLVQRRFSALEQAAVIPTTIFYRAVGDIPAGEMTVGDARLKGRLEQVTGVPKAFADSYPTALRGPSLSAYAERRIDRDLRSGEFLETRHLIAADVAADMRRQIPPGHELVALPVTHLTSAAYLVRPGDKVDIYQVRLQPSSADGKRAERAAVKIARDVEIFSVDDTLKGEDTEEEEGGRGLSYELVTIAVRTEDVPLFLMAREEGPVTLTLKASAAQ